MKKLNIAFVYDRINKFGGAEQVLLALHKIWPDAPLYTAVYNPQTARWASVFAVNPSFLQYAPFAKSHHELYPWLTPLAFESFTFDFFDVVISITSAEAKGILTKPGTCHICYCLTPTRYLWSGYEEYQDNPGLGMASSIAGFSLRKMAPILREWDQVASARPDYYLAISQRVKARIEKYYHRRVEAVIYPPVDVDKFKHSPPGEYFLTVSRLVGYKRVDLLIQAFNELNWPLVIIGNGREKSHLQKLAKRNIRFIGSVTNRELISWYQRCRAFVYCAHEDFGIAAVEAQAAGKPVVAFGKSGVAEIVLPGKTGELYEEQSVSSLVGALKTMRVEWYDSQLCQKNAQRFAATRFAREMKDTIETLYTTKTQVFT